MSITKLRPTFTFDQERLAALKAIAPEAFADGRIHWETLKEALGEHLEDEGQEAEHFGLTWPGKRAARRLASQPDAGTLRPAPGQGVNEETTRHLFVEGDNLEVLKLLQKSYAGRVKLIYIDPPYNTGNDFVYKDDYRQPLEEYLRATGQADEVGRVLTTNTKADGRFHSNWLSMMYPRLRLARDLLQTDGTLWVSIDDTEHAMLYQICCEIFGEENFIANFIWEKRITRENRRVFSFNHDYVLCFAKDKDLFQSTRNLLPLTEEVLSRYANPDNDPRGEWQSVSLNAQAGHATPSQFYEITTPGGRRLSPPPGRCWSVTTERLKDLIADNRIWFGHDGNNVPRLKVFKAEVELGLTPHTLWKADEVGTTDTAKKSLIELFDSLAVFDTPKPVELIRRMVQISTGSKDLVLDFFAGSCTTAQAVLELNREDGGDRRFIMVQLPEPTPPDSAARHAGCATIAEIGKERIRRVIQRVQAGPQARLIPERATPEDLGFRVFKLERSHFKAWQDYEGDDVAQLETLFDRFESPLAEGWQPDDLLIEIMLMQGFPLDSVVAPLADCPHNRVLRVASDLVAHELYVCLDARLHPATAEALALRPEDVFVCLDSALDEETKLRLQDGRNVMVI